MSTDMVTECDGNCCQTGESTKTDDKAEEFLANQNGKKDMIKCGCASKKVECGNLCQCDPLKCNNR